MTEPTEEPIDQSEVIDQIVVLMEELAFENRTEDHVRDLYGVHMQLSRAVGDRMGELSEQAKKGADILPGERPISENGGMGQGQNGAAHDPEPSGAPERPDAV